MVQKELIKFAFGQCAKAGITDAEIYYRNDRRTTINVEDGQIGNFQQSQSQGLNISGNYEGCFASSYIERMDEDAVVEAVKGITETAKLNGKPSRKSLLSQNTEGGENEEAGADISPKEIAENLKKAQAAIKAMDQRIVAIPRTQFAKTETTVELFGENGAELTNQYSYVHGAVGVVVQQGDIKQNAYSGACAKSFKEIDYDKLGRKAVEQAAGLLSASPVKSGDYEVVLEKEMAADLLSYFLPIFTAESAQRGDSRYAGKEGEEVASALLTMGEDPMLPTAPVHRSFDDEGVTTGKKFYIKDGKFCGFINSSSVENGGKLTGNGFRPSYKANAATTPWNVFVAPGEKTTEEILAEIPQSILITNADGLFAGVHPKTGDFSVIASGYLMENGSVKQAVNQITVGGNFYQLVKDVRALSSDTAGTGSAEGYVESPSIWIHGLKIGGL